MATGGEARIGVVTHADAMTYAEQEIDAVIARYLGAIERRLRLDVVATGPEDDAALDRPPDQQSSWRRITIEEVVLLEAATLHAWRGSVLATLSVEFQALIGNRL